MSKKVEDPNLGTADYQGGKKGFTSARQGKLRTMKSGIQQGGSSTHSRITDSICIYTPGEAVKFKYNASYENLATGLAGFFGSASAAGKEMSIKEAILDGGGAALELSLIHI